MEKTINWPKVKKIAGIVGNVVLWLFVAFSVLITVLVFSAQGSEDGVPSLFGKGMITIETDSMDPTFKVGDLVFINKLDHDEKFELEKGDIITFLAMLDVNGDGTKEQVYNTHRIVEKVSNGYKTQGDKLGSAVDNDVVLFVDVIGTCEEDDAVGGVGNAIKWLRSSSGFFICIVLPLVLFFLYELYNFINILVSERAKKKASEVSKETEEEIKRRAIEEYLKAQAAENAAESAKEEKKEEE